MRAAIQFLVEHRTRGAKVNTHIIFFFFFSFSSSSEVVKNPIYLSVRLTECVCENTKCSTYIYVVHIMYHSLHENSNMKRLFELFVQVAALVGALVVKLLL